METSAGKRVESLDDTNGANEIGSNGSDSLKTIAGVHEVGFFLSPREKIREKRTRESTPRAKGRVTILMTGDTFRLKDSNAKRVSISHGKSSGMFFDHRFSYVRYVG